MILNTHTLVHSLGSDCFAWEVTHVVVLEVRDAGEEGGASETAGEQRKGVWNNRNDKAVDCLTGNDRGGVCVCGDLFFC